MNRDRINVSESDSRYLVDRGLDYQSARTALNFTSMQLASVVRVA